MEGKHSQWKEHPKPRAGGAEQAFVAEDSELSFSQVQCITEDEQVSHEFPGTTSCYC